MKNSLEKNSIISIKRSKSLNNKDLINYIFRFLEDPNSKYCQYNEKNKSKMKKKIKSKKLDENFIKNLDDINSNYNNNNNNNEENNNFINRRKSLLDEKSFLDYLGIKEQKNFEKVHNKFNKLNMDFFKENYDNNENEKKFKLNELELKNELNYQIQLTNDETNKQRFINFLNNIEKLKEIDNENYIKLFENNFDKIKGELNELIQARETEERMNKFLFNLENERDYVISKKKYYEKKIKVCDYKINFQMGNKI